MSEPKKFLDEEGVTYLWSKISMEDYPNNDILVAVLNAIDETKADKEQLVQSDVNETNPESLAYIQNMPCREYTGPVEEWIYNEMVIDAINVENNQLIFPNPNGLILNSKTPYHINFYCIGETIEETFTNNYDLYANGNILESDGITFEFSADSVIVSMSTEQHTFTPEIQYYIMMAQTVEGTIVQKLDRKFLPDIPKADWNENNWDSDAFIQNRPFYSEQLWTSVEPALTDLTSTAILDSWILQFDLTEEFTFNIDEQGYYFYLLENDNAFAETYSLYHDEYFATCEHFNISILQNEETSNYYIQLSINNFINYPIDSSATYTLSIYTASMEEIVNTIDPKYLPYEILMGGDWNENNPDSPSYINGRTHYSEFTYETNHSFSGLSYDNEIETTDGRSVYFTSVTDESYVFNIEGVYIVHWPSFHVEERVYQLSDGTYYMGSSYLIQSLYPNEELWDSGEPFCITFDNTGTCFIYTTEPEYTEFDIETVYETVQKLDYKYLPNDIVYQQNLESIELITVNDIDTICGTTIEVASDSGVTF